MSTITALVGGDGVTTPNSMTKINTNFSNLNTDKMETSVLDTDTTLAANSNSKVATQKAVKTYVDAGGNVNASETTKGIVEEATDAEVTAGTPTGATGAKLFITPAKLAAYTKFKFGGTGADGALSVTSGTTAIDLGSAAVVQKNYTSISITGTGAITFTNPHANGTIVILKSQGAVTLTSSATRLIDLRGIGAQGGDANKENGNNPTGRLFTTVDLFGAFANDTAAGAGGSSGANGFYSISSNTLSPVHGSIFVCAGAGGGKGGEGNTGNNSPNSDGGDGGGAMIIECAGALNFTGTIDASGGAGADAGASGGSSAGSGGGGGGAAGMVVIVYNTLTANTGTITATGGAGGAGSLNSGATGNQGSGGGGAGSVIAAGGAGGGAAAAGSAAGGLGAGGGGGGGRDGIGNGGAGGAGGASMGGLVVENTWAA